MRNYPLIFTFRDAISGKGFLSGVTVTGRAVMTEENGELWMYGVFPAGIAETGQTMEETYSRFRNRCKAAFFDMAEEANSFYQFKELVQKFFYEEDESQTKEWMEALEQLRTGEAAESPFSELPRKNEETNPPDIEVVRLDVERRVSQFAPVMNVSDTYALAEAA
jgi:hypothetical protein